MPGKDGLLHISEVDWKHLQSLEGIMKEGDEVEVKLIDIDKKTGKMKLSRKVLMPRPEGSEKSDRPERPERSERPQFDKPHRPRE